MNVTIRHATMNDIPSLERLIAASVRELASEDYTVDQIEAALGSAWGIDSQLIVDQTYFLIEASDSIVACGGWSKRKALFGASSVTRAEPELLDPMRDPARIRAFFVHPAWARRGLGTLLLEHCETEARAAGFRSAELVATLPGERLYRARGYASQVRKEYALPNGGTITFVPMTKAKL